MNGPETSPRRWSIAQALRDSAYLLVGWPLHLMSFMVGVILMPVGLGLAAFGVGIPILMAGLAAAHAAARAESSLQQRLLGRSIADEQEGRPKISSARQLLEALRQPERAGEITLMLLAWFPATLLWSLVISWWISVLAFLSAPLWGAWGHSYSGLGTLLHIPGGPLARGSADVVAGLIMLALSPWIMRVMAWVQAVVNAFLLNAPARPLRAALRERQHRTRLTAAQDAEAAALRRLERDIHDGPQQRLVRLQLDLARAEREVDDPERAREILGGARLHAQGALDELRAASRGIAPQVLTEQGLALAVGEIAGRCPIPMRVNIEIPRLLPASETALYYLVSEAVTNVIKHSGAQEVRVNGSMSGGHAVVVVRDDGAGGAHQAKGSGLRGLQQRLAAVGGDLRIDSPEGGPTIVEGRVPCESS